MDCTYLCPNVDSVETWWWIKKNIPHKTRVITHPCPICSYFFTHRASPERLLNLRQITYRTPAFSNQTFLCDVQIEHVQGVVDSLDFAHLDEPFLDVFSGFRQDPVTMVLGLRQDLQNKQNTFPFYRKVSHYNDVTIGAIASQITSFTIVYSIVYTGAEQRKHQSSASLAFVWEFTGGRWIPSTNGQLRGKCFHLMTSLCTGVLKELSESPIRTALLTENLVPLHWRHMDVEVSRCGSELFTEPCSSWHHKSIINNYWPFCEGSPSVTSTRGK